MSNEGQFVAYEYKSITTTCVLESVYLDGFPNFGWEPDGNAPYCLAKGNTTAILKLNVTGTSKTKAIW